MKSLAKVFAFALLPLLFAAGVHADNISAPQVDRWRIPFNGTSSNTLVAVSTDNQLNMQDGISSVHEEFSQLISLSTNGYLDVAISTTLLGAGSSTYITGFLAQPIYPIGLRLQLWCNLETATSTYKSTATISGVNARGKLISERVLVSTTGVATQNAFAAISSVTWSKFDTGFTTRTANVQAVIGSTNTIGLTSDVQKSADVYKVNLWGLDNRLYTVNSIYDTITSTPTANFDKAGVWGRNTTTSPQRPH